METLEILKENALKAHSGANAQNKVLLENLFGEKTFARKITDRVKTFDDVLIVVGIHKSTFDEINAELSADEVAFRKLKLIAQALNEGWTPDWNSSSQYKYYPWFNLKNGFSFSGVVNRYRLSSVGSRLCFRTRELAEYAAATFFEEYKAFMVL